jgi:hypothetical protein
VGWAVWTIKVDSLDKRVDALDKKVDSLDKRVDTLDKKVDGLTSEVERQGAANDSRFQRTEEELSRQGVLGEERDSKLDLVLDGVLRINERLADQTNIGSMVKDLSQTERSWQSQKQKDKSKRAEVEVNFEVLGGRSDHRRDLRKGSTNRLIEIS